MRFSKVVGHRELINRLIMSVKNNKVSHSIMFLGNEGSGGMAIALAFAQYLNCKNRISVDAELLEDSCGECNSCKKMQKMIHPDVHYSYPVVRLSDKDKEPPISRDFISTWRSVFSANPYTTYNEWMDSINAENKQGNITIKECHQIIKQLSFKPFEGGNKIQIIWLPEYLGKNGNSLLKTIEEPASDTYFLFVAENKELILNTILSRCQINLLPQLPADVISGAMIENYEISQEEASKIAYLANGNYAESNRIYKSGVSDHFEGFRHWMRVCFANKPNEMQLWVVQISGKGREYIKDFLKFSIRMIRECYLIGSNSQSISHLSDDEQDFGSRFSPYIKENNVLMIYELLNKSYYYVERNVNLKILFFTLSLQINKLLSLNK